MNKSFFQAASSRIIPFIGIEGQSNAYGPEPKANLQADLLPTITGAKIYYQSDFVQLALGTNWGGEPAVGYPSETYTIGNHFGPEMRLAKLLRDYRGGVNIAKFAYPGASLSADWLPPSGIRYTSSITYNLAAQNKLGRKIDVMVWLQGETDASGDGTGAAAYQANIMNLINSKRTALGNPNLKYVLVALPPGSFTHTATVNAAMQYAANNMSNVYYLTHSIAYASWPHYNAAGYDQIATLIFNAIKNF